MFWLGLSIVCFTRLRQDTPQARIDHCVYFRRVLHQLLSNLSLLKVIMFN